MNTAKNATMFYQGVTSIDHSIFMRDGGGTVDGVPVYVFGSSFNLNITVYGVTNGDENVVVDFSTLKKRVKAVIDNLGGLDHTMWITSEQDAEIVANLFPEIGFTNFHHFGDAHEFSIRCMPSLSDAGQLERYRYQCGQLVEGFLNKKLLPEFPEVSRIGVELETRLAVPSKRENESSPFVAEFRYTHGLKHSTSIGCQNALHGHLSYVALFPLREGIQREKAAKIASLARVIASALHDKMIASKDNVKNGKVEYSCARGDYSFAVSPTHGPVDLLYLDDETTVEQITIGMAQRYHALLQKLGVSRMFISEGLNKGSFVEISDAGAQG